jgi:hypothetical protein
LKNLLEALELLFGEGSMRRKHINKQFGIIWETEVMEHLRPLFREQ